MDAITMLEDDHQSVETQFQRFERAGPRAYSEKRKAADRVIEELSVHAAIEEQVFYPTIRATVAGTEDVTLESLEEHHLVKVLLSELEDLDPDDERFAPKMRVLMENVRHHVEEEEGGLFPKVRAALDQRALADLGDAMEAARKVAPTHPHPHVPDTPPGNVVVGTAAGVADRIGDTVSGLAQGGVSAVGDLIDTILRRERSESEPTGPSGSREAAERVRSTASDATESAVDAARAAKRTAIATVETARAGAEETADQAARAGARTARAAKEGARSTAKTARKAAKRTAGAATASNRKPSPRKGTPKRTSRPGG